MPFSVTRSSQDALPRRRRTAVAIGNFDGVHCGHAALLSALSARQRQTGATPTVLTFDPHPARFFRPELAPPLITTEAQKLKLLAAHGVEVVVIEPFTHKLAALSPAAFFSQILIERLQAELVVVGQDFVFGHHRTGHAATLSALAREHDITAAIIAPVAVSEIPVSSTKIREFVLMGRVEGASLLLGRDYCLEGVVVAGQGRGRTIGVPTANLETPNELLPGRGVYAGRALLADGSDRLAVINIGHAPTFANGNLLTVEAHLVDTDVDLQGKPLTLSFSRRLRNERRFPSVDALVAQIKADIQRARDGQ